MLNRRIMVAGDAVAKFLDRGIEQFDNKHKDNNADQRQAFADVCPSGKKRLRTPTASKTNSWRNAASDRVTATRPFQLLMAARQIRSTPARPYYPAG